MKTFFFRLFLLGTVGLLCLAGYMALHQPSASQPALTVDEPDRDLGELPVGTHELVFRISNPADRPRRVVGLAEG